MNLLHVLKDTLPLFEIVGVPEDAVDVASEVLLVFPKKQQTNEFTDFFLLLIALFA